MFAKSTSARCLLLLSALAIAHGALPPEAFIQSVENRILQSPHLKQLAPKRSLEGITVHQATSDDQKLFDDFPSNPDGKDALADNLYVAVCPAASGDLEPISVPVRAIKAEKSNPLEGPIFFALQFKDGTVEQPPRVPPSPAVIDADMVKIAAEAEKNDSSLGKLTNGRSITRVEFMLNLKPLQKSEDNLQEARSYIVLTDEDVIEACVYNTAASSNSDKAGQDSTEDDGLKLKVRRLAGQKGAFDGATYKTPFVVMTIVAAVLIILVVVLLVTRDSSSEASSKQNSYV